MIPVRWKEMASRCRARARPLGYPAACGAIGFVLAALYFWPMPRLLTTQIIGDHPDRYFSLWGMDWVLRQWFGLRGELFSANILAPHRDALLFSDSFIGEALLAIPLRLAGVGWATFYNVLLLLALALAAMAAALLAAELLDSKPAGLVALVCFGFFPARALWVNHVNLQYNLGLPLCLWALWIYCRRGSPWAIYVAGLTLALQAYLSTQVVIWAVFALLCAAPLFAWVGTGWRNRRSLLHASGAVLAALVAVAPLVIAYRRMGREMGFARTMREAINYSGTLRGLWNARDLLRFDRFDLKSGNDEVGYLGVVVCGLALVGLVVVAGRACRGDRRPLLLVGAPALLLTLVGAMLFLGPIAKGFGDARLPFWWMRQIVPGLDGVRVPARAVILSHLGLGLLAAAGVDAALRRVRWRWLQWPIAVAVAAVIYLAWLPKPFRFENVRPPSAAVEVISQLPADAVVLPWPGFRVLNDGAYQDFDAAHHGRTIAGGYSGIFTRLYSTLYREIDILPEPRSLPIIQAMGVTHIVFAESRLEPWRRAALDDAVRQGALRGPVAAAAGNIAYEVVGSALRRADLDALTAVLPLPVVGPERVPPSSLATSALELPELFATPPRVDFRVSLPGRLRLRCGDRERSQPVRYQLPTVYTVDRRQISVSWWTPTETGACHAVFEAAGQMVAETDVAVDASLGDGAGSARITVLQYPALARTDWSADLVYRVDNTGQRTLAARSGVQWPFAKGEFVVECDFGSGAGYYRTAAEFGEPALASDLLPGASTVVRARMRPPQREGDYQLVCRATEEKMSPLGPFSEPRPVAVRR